MATKYFANKPIKHGFTHYRPGEEITGFTGWWRYWQLLRYNYVNKVDGAVAPVITLITVGDESLTVAFTDVEVGGDPTTDIEYRLDSEAWNTSGGVTSPFVIGELTNGTTYAVTIRAINASGAGAASAAVNGKPVTAPAAPTNLVATPGDDQLSIGFTAGDNGGSAITNYQYRVMPSTTYVPFDPADTTTPLVVTGLENGVEAEIFIRAVNAAGTSPGVSVTGTPAIPLPGAPSALVATPSALACSIAFVAPNMNGGSLVKYEHSFDNGGSWDHTTPDTVASPYLMTMPANDYTVVLRAVTNAGNGPKSAPVTFTVPGP